MRKTATAILLFDIVAGLLLLGLFGMQSRMVAADSRIALSVEANDALEVEDVRKIAITFDGDVIIGLSQGIGVVRDGQDRTESIKQLWGVDICKCRHCGGRIIPHHKVILLRN